MHRLVSFFLKYRIILFTVGIILILLTQIIQNGPTTDEPAHLAAGYGYSRGIALNPEHPPLLKVLNSLLFTTVFPGKLSLEREQYKIGWDILASQNGRTILILSRAIYTLVFLLSIGFVLWLGYRKYLEPGLARIIYAVVITSPLLVTQASLITFDTIAAVSALNFLLVATLLIIKKITFSSELFTYLWFWFCIGILVKFSLVLLVLPLIAIYIILFFQDPTQKKLLLKTFILGLLAAFFSILSITWYAFRNSPFVLPTDSRVPTIAVYFLESYRHLPDWLQKISDPLLWYISGLGRTFARTSEATSQFLLGSEFHGNYGLFFIFLYPFKENPVFLFILIGALLVSILVTKKYAKDFSWNELLVWFPILLFICSYSYFAIRSNLLLGLRHFYPILILTYVGVSVFGYWLYQHIVRVRKSLIFLFSILIVTNLFVSIQGLSYVSPLWQNEKWQIANDSSYIWGQDTMNALSWVHNTNLLRPENSHEWTLYIPWRTLGIQQYSELLHWEGDYSHYVIQDRSFIVTYEPPTRYLMVDAEVIQKQYAINCPKGCRNYFAQYSPWKDYRLIKTFRDTIFLFEKQ